MLLLPIAAGYAAGPDRGAVFGFFAGLVADLFLPTPFGLSALVGCLLGYATGIATRGLVRSSWWLAVGGGRRRDGRGPGCCTRSWGPCSGTRGCSGPTWRPPWWWRRPSAALLAVPVLRFVAWAVPEPGPSHGAPAGGGLR